MALDDWPIKLSTLICSLFIVRHLLVILLKHHNEFIITIREEKLLKNKFLKNHLLQNKQSATKSKARWLVTVNICLRCGKFVFMLKLHLSTCHVKCYKIDTVYHLPVQSHDTVQPIRDETHCLISKFTVTYYFFCKHKKMKHSFP